ncbi:hypothetical protein NDU88_001740 [Pleurodeles waltl]|uniref:Uncharacterized protein n=1 Tax=Pleurodeles waltl TaxID=8319 RepID=A0AAV7UAC1_PLEWA|nr:hypothetical protein NDU88_001740 [Pleurodeles waltl]
MRATTGNNTEYVEPEITINVDAVDKATTRHRDQDESGDMPIKKALEDELQLELTVVIAPLDVSMTPLQSKSAD